MPLFLQQFSIECNAVVWITRSATMATIGRNYPLTCNTQLWGTGCTIDAYLIYREGQLKSTNSTFTFRPLKLSDAGYYWCTATVKGFNFTSHQSFNPANIQSKNLTPSPIIKILFVFHTQFLLQWWTSVVAWIILFLVTPFQL